MTTDRIEELQEMKQEYILNETSLEIGQKSVSRGELAELQIDAETRWDETDEGQELAFLERGYGELTIELYKALKAALQSIEKCNRRSEFTGMQTPTTCIQR